MTAIDDIVTAAVSLPDDRRALLRTLAEQHDDFPAPLLARLVRRNADPYLSTVDRDLAWADLRGAVDLLAECRTGAVEWRHVVPGAPAHSAATIGLEALQQNIDGHLDRLMGVCTDQTCDDGVHYSGRTCPDTGAQDEDGYCPRVMVDGVGVWGPLT